MGVSLCVSVHACACERANGRVLFVYSRHRVQRMHTVSPRTLFNSFLLVIVVILLPNVVACVLLHIHIHGCVTHMKPFWQNLI